MSNNWTYILERNLYDSCINEDIEMLKLLLSEVGVEKMNDINLLMFSLDRKKFNSAKFLIENNVNIEVQDTYGNRPLHLAVIYNNFDLVNLLVGKGANLECRNKFNLRPIHLAIRNKYREIAIFLIAKETILRNKGIYSNNLIKLAIFSGDIEILKSIFRSRKNLLLTTSKNNLRMIMSNA